VKASAKFYFKKEEKTSESELQMAGAEGGVVTHEICLFDLSRNEKIARLTPLSRGVGRPGSISRAQRPATISRVLASFS